MNELFDFVDKIYCVNLDSRKDRWEQVTHQFTQIGIVDSVTRVSAIVDEDPRKGCLESHFFCINDAIDNGYENVLIFEDDVCFLSYDSKVLIDVVDYLAGNALWDLFYLGGNVMYPAKFVHEHVFKSRFFSTHAYIVNRRAFEKILNATVPIDVWYAWNTISYGLYPMYATQDETYSDIRQKKMDNLEEAFTRKYDLLVKPNIIMRWVNYINTHYLVKLRIHS
jgi:GR25 family glycosyltransferase involved in LPS biosynthesis